MKRQAKQPPRLRDLPGFPEAFEKALAAERIYPLGHKGTFVGKQALTTAGNFVAPPTIDRVTTRLLLCMAIGIHWHRMMVSGEKRRAEQKKDNVISFHECKRRRDERLIRDGYDCEDPATWASRPSGLAMWAETAFDAVTQDLGGVE